MDFEGKIFEFREIEAQNKGEKVNKTICFKGSGALNQRQESIVHDCTVMDKTFLTVPPRSLRSLELYIMAAP